MGLSPGWGTKTPHAIHGVAKKKNPHFMETEAQRDSVIHLWPPRWQVGELGFEPESLGGPGAVAQDRSGGGPTPK